MTTFPTTMPVLDLPGLVGSRLCHDIISPLGAIGNGVELLHMSDAFPGLAKSPEMALIVDAVAVAHSRIQAFRLAFGQAGGEQRLPQAELRKHLDGLIGQSRLRVDLEAEGDLPRVEVRMILLAVMCLESALPWGGRVLICRAAPGWRLVAEADRSKPDPALWAWLGGGDTPVTPVLPAQVHFPLLAQAAASAGKTLRWEVDEQGAEIAF